MPNPRAGASNSSCPVQPASGCIRLPYAQTRRLDRQPTPYSPIHYIRVPTEPELNPTSIHENQRSASRCTRRGTLDKLTPIACSSIISR